MKIAPTITEDDAFLPASWRVVTALLTRPALTQAELRAATGLSHPVIVQQVNALRAQALVIAGPLRYGRPGRPGTPLTFNWHCRRVLVLDVHPLGCTAR
ncbi:MAG TPA: helix-turn-helix domain-containing protein, partial [Armatimonadota bacterium]|nr:helix-turn-helix domain-containing protein [Armatimonadota bacterium]